MKSAAALALTAALLIPAAFAIAEAPAGKPAFGRFDPDANHDGYLSRAEAIAAAEARFKRMDADGDGKLKPGEHPEHHRGPPPGAPGFGGPPPGPSAEAGTPPAGRNGEGRRWHRRHGPPMGGFGLGQDIFTEYDSNHDGALSLAEFKAHALKVFEARDGNHDGKVKLPARPPMGPGWGPPPPKG